jgi:DNA-binding beta-propeller fold protein YncE
VNSPSKRRPDRRHVAFSAVLATALAGLLALATVAQASELLYWDNYESNPDNVGFANVDGSGGGLLNLGATSITGPEGMAYDSVTNRLFVADETGKGQILAINLDGSGAAPFTAPGAPIEEPEGVAVDPVSRTIYWENVDGEGSIVWAKLDGSAGGLLNLTGAPLNGPCCRIAIDPAGGRVYWANTGAGTNTIAFANLNNTGGGGELNLTGSTVEPGGEGLAVDDATGRLYFLGGTNEIGYANLNGSGGGNVSSGGAVIKSPWGIALDPSISRLYWANEGNAKGEGINAFGFVNPSGGSAGNISVANTLAASPQDPVILKSPSGTEAPKATRSTKSRSTLSCSTGAWGADFPGSFVYQSPRAFAYQWTSKGKAVKGATAASFQAKSAGKYACVVTASNQAGSASQTSAAVNVKAAKVKLTTKKKVTTGPGGLAKFKLNAVNQGDLKAGGARVCVKVAKKDKSDLKAPKCKSLGGLKGRGKRTATLKVKVGQGAAGTYKLTFLVRGSAGTSAKAKILVK